MQPLPLGTAFGELVINIRAKTTRDFAHHLVDAFTFELSGRCGLDENQIPHISGVVIWNNIFLLDGHKVRQQDVGVLRRGGHEVFQHDDHLALRVILQNIVGFIDVGMLVGDGITGIVPDEFDRHIQFVFAAHAIFRGSHLRATGNGISPAKTGNLCFDRIFQHGHAFNGDGIGGFTCATIAAINANIAG
ncbi:hypothetical protein SRABI106_03226 [Rahnella aquatilis]|nr:hypothetical protein SRABI106_03226 [Rahnella aquatilis]